MMKHFVRRFAGKLTAGVLAAGLAAASFFSFPVLSARADLVRREIPVKQAQGRNLSSLYYDSDEYPIDIETLFIGGGTMTTGNGLAYEELLSMSEPDGKGIFDGAFGIIDETSFLRTKIGSTYYEARCGLWDPQQNGDIHWQWTVVSYQEDGSGFKQLSSLDFTQPSYGSRPRFFIHNSYLYINWEDVADGKCTRRVDLGTGSEETEGQIAEYLTFNADGLCVYRGADLQVYCAPEDRSYAEKLPAQDPEWTALIGNTLYYTRADGKVIFTVDLNTHEESYLKQIALKPGSMMAYNHQLLYCAIPDEDGGDDTPGYSVYRINLGDNYTTNKLLTLDNCELKGFRASKNFLYFDTGITETATASNGWITYYCSDMNYGYNLWTGELYWLQARAYDSKEEPRQPETVPPETQPQETQPAQTEPPQTEPPETEPPVVQPVSEPEPTQPAPTTPEAPVIDNAHFAQISEGNYLIRSAASWLVLDIYGEYGSSEKLANVQVFQESSLLNNSQRFAVHGVQGGWYQLIPLSNTSCAVNAYSSSPRAGDNVNIYEILPQDSTQGWYFEQEGVFYRIRNAWNPDVVLTAEGNNNESNVSVQDYAAGNLNQLWRLEMLPDEPEPTQPAPTQPAPTQPVPTEPVPTQPVPTQPAPTQPVPTEPVPTQPVPTVPVPTQPVPTTEPVPETSPVPETEPVQIIVTPPPTQPVPSSVDPQPVPPEETTVEDPSPTPTEEPETEPRTQVITIFPGIRITIIKNTDTENTKEPETESEPETEPEPETESEAETEPEPEPVHHRFVIRGEDAHREITGLVAGLIKGLNAVQEKKPLKSLFRVPERPEVTTEEAPEETSEEAPESATDIEPETDAPEETSPAEEPETADVPVRLAVWTCENGHSGNTGNFCPECGAKRPASCANCGYVFENGVSPKFCPNCGARQDN